MDRIECARQLRTDPNVHYNCCQSVLIPFADKIGMTKEQLTALGAHFGSGMRHGSACGAFSGAMMALGLLGYDEQVAASLIRQFKADHGATDCATLLKTSRERGEAKMDHCNGLIFEMVAALDAILAK